MDQNNRILVAEDDPECAQLLTTILVRRSYEVMVVSDGRAALNGLDSFKPTLILLDMLLPVVDGWGFLEQYSKQPNSDIPIIAFSAGYIDSLSLPGVATFVTKPFSATEILAAVNNTLAEACHI